MAISKVIFDGEVQMDVTQDTVTPNSLLSGYTATAASGDKISGNIQSKSSSDITVNGATVTVPSGYYDRQQTKSVATGSAGTPTATKGTVSNHSVSVTPKVTNTTGYISGGTKTGTAVTVNASELVSGSQTITSNSTVNVTNLAEVVVNVPPNNQDKTINPSQSQQIITADSGYTGLGTVTVTAMPSGSVTASATKGTVSNNSVRITPVASRSAGYITSGTTSGTEVTVTASELVSGSQTVQFNDTYDVTNLAELVVDVEGGNPPINNQSKTVDPSVSQQTVTYDSGYTGLETVVVRAMPSGTEGTPEAEVTTDQQTQNIVVTPKVTNTQGYISGGLRVGDPVTINPGVTSFNGQTGAVTYTAPVTSVNSKTGAVTLKTSDLTNDSGYITSVPNGTTSVKGIVQLSTSTSSTSTTLAATASAVKAAYDHYPSAASTSAAGIVQLSDSVSSTSTTLAATANAVRSAYNHTPANIYVTAKGTTSSWAYRKWSDLTYECWKTIEYTLTVDGAWGSDFYKTVGQQSYPVTFTSAPYEVATISSGTKSLFLANDGNIPQTTTKTGGYLVLRPTNAGTSITFKITYYVRGTVSS